MYCHVELGVGLNPKAPIGRGVELEDEFGTLHLGIGNGMTFGSSIRAVGHVDLVIRRPIVEVDDRVVLKNREMLV
jgi:leucyl aminopeptidase (aminopeptidase T)